MSASVTPLTSSPSSPTSTDTSTNSSVTDVPEYYDCFFILFAIIGIIIFCLLQYFQRRRRRKNARQQQRGRAALAQDVESWSLAGLWTWRAPRIPPTRHLRHAWSLNECILEPSREESDDAPPPPYRHNVAADKAAALSRTSWERTRPSVTRAEREAGIPVGEVQGRAEALGRLPPSYGESTGSEGGLDVPARPAAVVTAAERVSEADLEEQPLPGRSGGAAGRATNRWGSMRRLMSSTDRTT